jgi:putative membrane protein
MTTSFPHPTRLISAAVLALAGWGALAQTTAPTTARPPAAAASPGASAAATTPVTPTTPAASATPMTRAAKAELPRGDRKFLEEAAEGGMAEVELGKLAGQRASSDQVKQFGSKMVADHGKANDELKSLASGKGVQWPTSMGRSHQKDLDRLGKLSGADFDRQYMKHMVADHKKDVSAFQKQARSAHDADVKAFAAKTLPTLQDHLRSAQTVEDAVKKAK